MPPADTLRAFLAVFPSPPAEQALNAYVDQLRREQRGVSWVKPGNLHFTLRFLGDISPQQVEAAKQAADAAALGKAAFAVATGAPGAFPSLERPRVVWLGLEEGRGPLVGLAAELEQALVKAGLGKADKPFAPHLTLGRVREGLPPSALPALLKRCPAPAVKFEAASLRLVRSQLDPRGSIYTVIHEAMLDR